MQKDSFEQAFGNFLEREEYDEAYGAIFTLVRAAFLAGWKARESQPPAEILLLQKHRDTDIK